MEKKYFHGFTLVELLIVISIIAILAAIVVAYFTGQIFKGNDAKRKGDLDRIKVAAEEYEKDNNCYPSAVVCTPSDVGLQPYLDRIPCDPVTHVSYYYETDNESCPHWFRIYATLENIKDVSILSGIGKDGKDNYYQGSDNAPVLTAEPTPTPLSCPHDYWGCMRGVCTKIDWKPNCSGPICQPGFDNDNCNGQCGSPSDPQNECSVL